MTAQILEIQNEQATVSDLAESCTQLRTQLQDVKESLKMSQNLLVSIASILLSRPETNAADPCARAREPEL